MKTQLSCHSCGVLQETTPPLSRRDTCNNCMADLKACLNCIFFDPNSANECLESEAEQERDKERGNSCEYFKAQTKNSAQQHEGQTTDALKSLEKLFGG